MIDDKKLAMEQKEHNEEMRRSIRQYQEQSEQLQQECSRTLADLSKT